MSRELLAYSDGSDVSGKGLSGGRIRRSFARKIGERRRGLGKFVFLVRSWQN